MSKQVQHEAGCVPDPDRNSCSCQGAPRRDPGLEGDWKTLSFGDTDQGVGTATAAVIPDDSALEAWCQHALGLAFDYGRVLGNLELREVELDREMLRNCDERAAEEIERLRAQWENLGLKGWLTSAPPSVMHDLFPGPMRKYIDGD